MYEETIEMLTEQIDQLEQIKKRKLPFNDRMGLIGMLCQLSEDQLPLLAAIADADKVGGDAGGGHSRSGSMAAPA